MTNACTLWPDRFFSAIYAECCATHDVVYDWKLPRVPGDYDLAYCVWESGAPYWWAFLMLIGVLVFGAPVYYLKRSRKPDMGNG